jgi:hypothetical protein
MLAVMIESDEPLGDVVMKKLKRKAELTSHTPNSVEVLLGTQTGIWGLFGDMMVISWMYSDEKAEYKAAAQQDMQRLIDSFPDNLESLGLPKQTLLRYGTHEGTLHKTNQSSSSPTLGTQWRTLFAQLVIQLEHGQSTVTKESA